MLLPSQAATLIEIEGLVNQIIKNEQERKMGRRTSAGDGLEMLCLKLMRSMGRYLSVYDKSCEYSEHLEAFWAGCRVAGLIDRGVEESWDWPSPNQVGDVIGEIIKVVNSTKFKRKGSDRRYETKQKRNQIQEYAKELHAHYSRLLVVRVDWGYRNEHQVMIKDVYSHLDEMIEKITSRTEVFENLVGYAWCIEQGISRGYHLHTVFYFHGSKHQNDWYMAQQIGEQWVTVTEGLGTYHSCNTAEEKAKFEKRGKLGVGMIHRNDEMSCENAIEAIGYLADPEKEDQYLRVKPEGRRAFATGQLPKTIG